MAMNDVTILMTIIAILFFSSMGLYFVYQGDYVTLNMDNVVNNASGNVEALSLNPFKSDSTPISFFRMLVNVFIFSFGDLPLWLDGFFIILKITGLVVIIRNVWIGGGG